MLHLGSVVCRSSLTKSGEHERRPERRPCGDLILRHFDALGSCGWPPRLRQPIQGLCCDSLHRSRIKLVDLRAPQFSKLGSSERDCGKAWRHVLGSTGIMYAEGATGGDGRRWATGHGSPAPASLLRLRPRPRPGGALLTHAWMVTGPQAPL